MHHTHHRQPPPPAWVSRRLRALLCFCVLCLGCLLFFTGLVGEDLSRFAPTPPPPPPQGTSTPRDGTPPPAPPPGTQDACSMCQPVGGRRPQRIILLLIDGLRYSAVFGGPGGGGTATTTTATPFRYTANALASGFGVHALSVARPPTVTLPRLKSLVSGKVSVFSDLLFNFFGSSSTEDGLFEALRAARPDERVLLFGDDTWLRTWPDVFDPDISDPVRSFFVSDYTEVDDNVTRHIASLAKSVSTKQGGGDGGPLEEVEWSLAVMHYLGVDHIGHYLGAENPEMRRKEREMDEVIESIHRDIVIASGGSCALAIVSDHGMTDGGNHGGSSTPEVETFFAVLFADRDTRLASTSAAHPPLSAAGRNPSTVQQIDIAPSLSLLLGMPPPASNTGVPFPPLFTPATLPHCLRCAARQVAAKAPHLLHSTPDVSDFIRGADTTDSSTLLQRTFQALDSASEQLNAPGKPDTLLTLLGASLISLCWARSARRSADWAPYAVPALLLFSSTFAEEMHKVVHYITATAIACHALLLLLQDGARTPRPLLLRLLLLGALLRLLLSWTHSGILAMTSPAEHPRLSDVLHAESMPVWAVPALRGALLCAVGWMAAPGASGLLLLLLACNVQHAEGMLLGSLPPWWGVAGAGPCLRWALLLAAAAHAVWPGGSSERRGHAVALGAAAASACVSPARDADPLLICTLASSLLVSLAHRGGPAWRAWVTRVTPLVALCAQSSLGRSISLGHMQFSSVYGAVVVYHPVVVSALVLLTHYGGFLVVALPHMGEAGVRRACAAWAASQLLAAGAAAYALHSHLFIYTVFIPKLLFASCDAAFTFLLIALYE